MDGVMKFIYMNESGSLTYRGEYEAVKLDFDEGEVWLDGEDGWFPLGDFALRDTSINDGYENNKNEDHFGDHIPGRD